MDLPTKWKISFKTDENLEKCGTATAVPAVPRAAPLKMYENYKRKSLKQTLGAFSFLYVATCITIQCLYVWDN